MNTNKVTEITDKEEKAKAEEEKTGDKGEKAKVEEEKAKVEEQKTEDKGEKAKIKEEKTEDEGEKAKVEEEKTEDKREKAKAEEEKIEEREKTQKLKKAFLRKIDSIASILTLITLIATIGTCIVSSCDLHYSRVDKNIEYNKENNLYIERIAENDDNAQVQYSYSIQSSETRANYSNITLLPMLHIYIVNEKNEIQDSTFLRLPDYYILLPTVTLKGSAENTELLRFADYSHKRLSESVFRNIIRGLNARDASIYMDADIVYLFQYKYNTKRDEVKDGKAMISRRQDYLSVTEKPYLFFDESLLEKYDEALAEQRVYDLKCIKEYMSQPIHSFLAINSQTGDFAGQSIDGTEDSIILQLILEECIDYMEQLSSKYNQLCDESQNAQGNH